MNKIVSTKRTSAIFLAIVLVTGTIAAISPSFIIKGVNAQPYYGMDNRYNSYGPTPEYPDNNYYNSYESDYGMDNDDRKSYGNDNSYKSQYSSYKPDYKPKYPSYGKDDKRDKSKDSKKSVSINKLKCINTNLNINGVNSGNISIGNKGAAEGGYLGVSSSAGSGYGGDDGYNKQGKGFDCIINNNNTNTNIVTVGGNVTDGGNQTDGNGDGTAACEGCFNANATLAGIIDTKLDIGGAINIPGFMVNIPAAVNDIPGLCDFLEANPTLQTQAGLTAVINAILAQGVPPSPPAPVSQASITILVNCLLTVDFG